MGVEFVAVDNPHGQQTDHPHPGGRCRTRARGDLGAHQGDPGGRQGAGKAAGHARTLQGPSSACAWLVRRRRPDLPPTSFRSFGTSRRLVIQASTPSPGSSTLGRSLPLTAGNGGMCRCGRFWIGPIRAGWSPSRSPAAVLRHTDWPNPAAVATVIIHPFLSRYRQMRLPSQDNMGRACSALPAFGPHYFLPSLSFGGPAQNASFTTQAALAAGIDRIRCDWASKIAVINLFVVFAFQ